jgi:hypothetical protein
VVGVTPAEEVVNGRSQCLFAYGKNCKNYKANDFVVRDLHLDPEIKTEVCEWTR